MSNTNFQTVRIDSVKYVTSFNLQQIQSNTSSTCKSDYLIYSFQSVKKLRVEYYNIHTCVLYSVSKYETDIKKNAQRNIQFQHMILPALLTILILMRVKNLVTTCINLVLDGTLTPRWFYQMNLIQRYYCSDMIFLFIKCKK